MDGGDDITIRFDVEIHESPDGRTYNSSTLKENLAVFEQKYGGSNWQGDVYKYSKKPKYYYKEIR